MLTGLFYDEGDKRVKRFEIFDFLAVYRYSPALVVWNCGQNGLGVDGRVDRAVEGVLGVAFNVELHLFETGNSVVVSAVIDVIEAEAVVLDIGLGLDQRESNLDGVAHFEIRADRHDARGLVSVEGAVIGTVYLDLHFTGIVGGNVEIIFRAAHRCGEFVINGAVTVLVNGRVLQVACDVGFLHVDHACIKAFNGGIDLYLLAQHSREQLIYAVERIVAVLHVHVHNGRSNAVSQGKRSLVQIDRVVTLLEKLLVVMRQILVCDDIFDSQQGVGDGCSAKIL